MPNNMHGIPNMVPQHQMMMMPNMPMQNMNQMPQGNMNQMPQGMQNMNQMQRTMQPGVKAGQPDPKVWGPKIAHQGKSDDKHVLKKEILLAYKFLEEALPKL